MEEGLGKEVDHQIEAGVAGHLNGSGTGKRRAGWEAMPSLLISSRKEFLSFHFIWYQGGFWFAYLFLIQKDHPIPHRFHRWDFF